MLSVERCLNLEGRAPARPPSHRRTFNFEPRGHRREGGLRLPGFPALGLSGFLALRLPGSPYFQNSDSSALRGECVAPQPSPVQPITPDSGGNAPCEVLRCERRNQPATPYINIDVAAPWTFPSCSTSAQPGDARSRNSSMNSSTPMKTLTNFDRYIEEQMRDPAMAERIRGAGAAWDVALQIAALREQAGLSQQQLAALLGTSQQQVSR